MEILNQQLLQQFTRDHQLHDMARYHLASGGKCLRGHLALSESETLGVAKDKAQLWALSCELLHNATLIHDDIQDNDPVRRGQPSLWKKYGVAEAINAGDFLIFKSFRLASEIERINLVSLLAQTAELLVQGQMDELDILKKDDSGYWNAYQDMAMLKTGTLFLLPIEGAHIIANEPLANLHRQAWLDLGVCYQIVDDLRDFLGLKQVGQKQKDLDEKKINALIAFLSTHKEQFSLIEDYLNTPSESTAFEKLKIEINKNVKKLSVVEKLQGISNDSLSRFRANSSSGSQKVILNFLNKAVEVEETKYVTAEL